ncbi:MAG: hypothetical protein WB762_21370 [Candidatus Sulfotelmatobacter sp.]
MGLIIRLALVRWRTKYESATMLSMDDDRKRVIGIMAAIPDAPQLWE